MLLKLMSSVTQVCIICTDLSKLRWHREGVAKTATKTQSQAPRSLYCCTSAVPGVSMEFTKPGAEPEAGCQLANVGGTRVSDKNSFRNAAEKKASFHTQHSPCKSGLKFGIMWGASALQVRLQRWCYFNLRSCTGCLAEDPETFC